jgi:hypothetical protein
MLTAVWLVAGLAVLATMLLALYIVRRKQMHLWLPDYLLGAVQRPLPVRGTVDLFLCVCDHFEPSWTAPGLERERARVDEWMRRYPPLARRHLDADGNPYQHTFFFPIDEYRHEHVERLARLRDAGLGDVEIHLHHRDDSSETLRARLLEYRRIFSEEHRLLHRNPETGDVEYAFIHGNWTLDNSNPDGSWCGVNDELQILRATGCYADFTLPSAPNPTQTRTVNRIYYAVDDPARPKSHDRGLEVEVGRPPSGDLLIIQGPLALDWRSRKFGLLPRIDNAEVAANNPPTPRRADRWIRQGIHVKGRPEWLFVKLHTHGAQEQNFDVLLGEPMDTTLRYLEARYNDGMRYRLHYVTAREMYLVIKAAESGVRGNPGPLLQSVRARPTPEIAAAS